MTRYALSATTAFLLMTGIAVAQTSTSTSTTTQSTTTVPVMPAPLPVPGSSTETNTRTTVDGNGVVTDKTQTYTRGTVVTPPFGAATTSKTTESTTTR